MVCRLLPLLITAALPLAAATFAGQKGGAAPLLARAAAPTACAGAHLVTDAARPRQGSLFRIRVTGAPDGAELRGRAGGEPLHFSLTSATHEALAAAPIDGDTSLPIVLVCSKAGHTDSLHTVVRLATADYPLERLTVAPRYSAPPDAALTARMKRESALAAKVSRRSHDTPRLWGGPFRRPREARVTSPFGSGRQFNGIVTSRHMGTDYAGAIGAPVHAANRGIVRLVDSFFLGGNVVYLDHGGGLVTAYLHLSEQTVAVGDTVAQGDVIGKVGATGRVTGPHLHWITRYGAVTVDPASLLRVTGGEADRR